MKLFVAALRTLLVVIACLGVLGFVAWLLGEVPPRDGFALREAASEAAAARAQAAEEAAARDEVTPVAAPEIVDASVDAGPPPLPPTPRFFACDGSADASLSRVQLDPRGRELIALACGDELRLIGFVGRDPVSVVRLAPAAIDQAAPVRRYTLASADVTGDGAIDLLVGTRRSVDAASPSTGSLHLVANDGRGGLSDAALLAPIAVSAIDVGRVDDDAVLDIAVLHRPDMNGSRAPEAWVFRGGPSPVRIARIALGRDANTLALADVDLDGFSDLVPSGRASSTTAILAGNGLGGFARHIDVATPGAERVATITTADLGTRLLFIGATPIWLVPAQTTPALVPVTLEGTPISADLRAERALQPRIAWLADGIVGLFDLSSTTPAPTRTGTLSVAPEAGRITSVLLGDFVGAPTLDIALMVERNAETLERDLVMIVDVEAAEQRLTFDGARLPIERAPLSLDIALR